MPPLEINIDSESLQPVPIAGSQEEAQQTPDFAAFAAPDSSAISETMGGKTTPKTAVPVTSPTAPKTAVPAAPSVVFPIAAANAAPVVLPAPEQQKPLLPFMGPRLEKLEPDPAFRPENFLQKLPVPDAQSTSVPKLPVPSSTVKSQTTNQRPAPSSTQVSSNPLRNSQIRAGAESKTPPQTQTKEKSPSFVTSAGTEINSDMLLLRPDQKNANRPTNVLDLESLPVTTEVEVPMSTLPYPILEKVNETKQKTADKTPASPVTNPFLKEIPTASEIQATSEIPVTSSDKETVRKPQTAATKTPLFQAPLKQAPLKQAPLKQAPLKQDSLKQDSLKQDSLKQDSLKQDSFSLPRQINAPEPETPQVALPDQKPKQTTTLSAPGAVAPYPSSTIAIKESQVAPVAESIVSKDGILYEYPLPFQDRPVCQANQFRINGYANAGVFCNTHGYRNNGLSNCQSDSAGALNGLYLSVGKDICTECQDFDWGYDVDFMFGYDARYLQTYSGLDQSWVTGHTTRGQRGYGFAMPQVYAELGYKDFRIKAGHFYTLLGYERSRADERFFYSQGLAYQALPITHTGVLLSYEGLEHWTGTIGWVNGVDTGFDNDDGESLVIGELKYNPWRWLRAKYAFVAGNLSVTELNPFDVLWQDNRLNAHFPQGGRSGQGATHSFVAEMDLGKRWTYVFEFDYNDSQNDIMYTVLPEGGGALRNGWGNWKMFSQDLFYTWNDCWKWGVRVEWWKANMTTHRYDNNTNWTGRGKLTSVTVAANWTPGQRKRLVVRPEIRYDHASEPLFAGERKRDQLYLGGDVMFKY